ncbi:MAG: beta-propeller fold lactonase family protein [Terracidiphilus sp.]
MKWPCSQLSFLGFLVLLASGCGGRNVTVTPTPSPSCVPSSKSEFAYALTGYTVSMYTVNSCTGAFSATSPANIPTGYAAPQAEAEEMVADPLGRFAYVANLVSNASDLSTISMYAINSTTGVLSPTTPATVPTGWFPQEIAIDPLGRFVYTANSDDSSISMFAINQSSGVLTPTTPSSVSTVVPGNILADPGFLTVDPSGRFLYVTESLTNGAAVLMFSINQTTGLLTPTSPATVSSGGIPWQVVIAPSGKFAYVVNNLSGPSYSLGVSQYTVDSTTGVLTPGTPWAVAAGNAPTAIAVDPTSRFAYVVNRQDNTVSMFTIDPNTGNLTLNATANDPSGTVATGTEPFRIVFDRSGKFVYVVNEQSPVTIYTVNSDGTLTATGSTGTSALSVAITNLPD